MNFEIFYKTLYAKAIGYARKKINSEKDAEDIVSDAFLYCYNHFSSYDEEKASINTWFFLVLNSRIKNYYRDAKTNESIESVVDYLIDERDYIEEAIELEELRGELATALNQLGDIQREIVVCRYFNDMSSREVAQKLNLSEGAVRTNLSRALIKMRKYIMGHETMIIPIGE